MTRFFQITSVFAAICLAGCTGGSEPEFCRDHHLFHADHADDIGMLTIELAADDTLQKILRLPNGTTLTDPDDELFGLTFRDDGRLRQIEVFAFDQMPELDEIEVTMTTPVTRKRFAINRQCPNPVFRLD